MILLHLTEAGSASDAIYYNNLDQHTCSFKTEDGMVVEGYLNRTRPLGNRMVRMWLYMPDENVEKYFDVHEGTQVIFVPRSS